MKKELLLPNHFLNKNKPNLTSSFFTKKIYNQKMTNNLSITHHNIEVLNKECFDSVEKIILKSGLINSCFASNYNSTSIDLIKSKFLKNEVKIFIASIEKQIISFTILLLKPNALSTVNYDWQIAYIYVDIRFRNNKFGESILRYAINYAIKTKANEISLCTTSDNHAALGLYKKLKFKENKFIANYTSFNLDLNHIRNKKDLSHNKS